MKKSVERYKSGRWSGKHYNFFGDYLWDKYKCRVLKLPINANLSCPNRNGTGGKSGCIFCSDDGSASPTTLGGSDIPSQMEFAKKSFKRSDHSTKYIAYFQAFTNTYAPLNVLRELYESALKFPDITGLMIGTRPDSLPEPVLDLIASYKQNNFELWLEIGMQTMHEKSLKFLNRGHNHKETIDAVKRASYKGIPVCVHIILGIPGESWSDMMATAEETASLPVKGVKFHHLHIIKGTPLEEIYINKKIKTITMKEYISTLCDFIERLGPDIVVHRIIGDRNENSLVAPLWGLHKGTVLKAVEDEFIRRGTFQGFLFEKL